MSPTQGKLLSGPAVYLVLASASPPQVARGIAPSTQLPWIYLGCDYIRMLSWEKGLGHYFRRVPCGDALQTVAAHLRRPYLEWTASLGAPEFSVDWWTSYVAERNTASESLFHHVCFLALGYETATGGESVVIVVESPAVLTALVAQKGVAARARRLSRHVPVTTLVRRVAVLCARWAWYALDALGALGDARATGGGGRDLAAAPDVPRVLIHSCLDDAYFGEDGEPHDRYFTVLAQELRRRGYEVRTMPWLNNVRRRRRDAFAWFRRRPAEYLVPEDFYGLWDYVWAGWRVLRGGGRRFPSTSFAGLDVSLLLDEARWVQRGAVGTARFLRYGRLIHRLKQRGFKIDVWIDTFENMASEKPAVMALRQLMPETLTVGFQHYVAPAPLHLPAFTTAEEAQRAPHPDVIVCNSPFTARLLGAEGFPESKLRAGASLRYLYLQHGPPPPSPEPGAVLLVLPIQDPAAYELLHKTGLALGREPGLTFWVKPHPMMQARERSRDWAEALLPNVTMAEGPMSRWLPRASCVLVTASTSALEVALAGVPVVQVGRETDFDMDPLAWFPERVPPARSPEQIRSQVMEALGLFPEERAQLEKWAREKRDSLLSPLTAETVDAFVRP